jgi:hypothetical protein
LDQFELKVVGSDWTVPYEIQKDCDHLVGRLGFTEDDNFIDLSTADYSGVEIDTLFNVSKLGDISGASLSVDTIDAQVISNSNGSVVINDDTIVSGTLGVSGEVTLDSLTVGDAATFNSLITANSGVVNKYITNSLGTLLPNSGQLDSRFGTGNANGFVGLYYDSEPTYEKSKFIAHRVNNEWTLDRLNTFRSTGFVFDQNTIISGNLTVTGDTVGEVVGAKISASDILIISADTERTTSSETLVKMKEIKTYLHGTHRVSFRLKSTGSETVEGRVYKNGVAVGTLRSTWSTSYQTYSEDIAFVGNDAIQLYIRTTDAGAVSATCDQFRIFGSMAVVNTD